MRSTVRVVRARDHAHCIYSPCCPGSNFTVMLLWCSASVCCRVDGFAVFTMAMHRDGASSGKLSYGRWSSSLISLSRDDSGGGGIATAEEPEEWKRDTAKCSRSRAPLLCVTYSAAFVISPYIPLKDSRSIRRF